MGDGITLWQLLKEKVKSEKEEPSEFKIFNPLKGKIGDFVSIEAVDLYGKNFLISEIDVYKTVIGGKIFESCDYILREGENWVTLRVLPLSNPDPYSHKHATALVLFPDSEMEYDKKFHKKILPAGTLEVKDTGKNLSAVYTRCNGIKEPYTAEVAALKDPAQEPEKESLVYWDFERKTDDGKIEYYFVEMNSGTGWFQMFRGFEVSEKDVTLLPAGKP